MQLKNPQKTAAILFVDPFHELFINFSQSIEDTICNSGHDIMYEEPNLIIDNIKLLISKLP